MIKTIVGADALPSLHSHNVYVYSKIQYRTVQNNVVQYNALQFSTAHATLYKLTSIRVDWGVVYLVSVVRQRNSKGVRIEC